MQQPAVVDDGASAYEQDFQLWIERQVALLRARRADAIDWDHIAEEIESLGARDRRELASRLVVILMHLLKWQFQPNRRSRSWRDTLETQRYDIELLIEQSPSLRARINDLLPKAFGRAAELAARQTKLAAETFPSTCPYTVEQVLDRRWLPGAQD